MPIICIYLPGIIFYLNYTITVFLIHNPTNFIHHYYTKLCKRYVLNVAMVFLLGIWAGKGNMQLRALEIVQWHSVPVSVQKPSAYFRQRHTVQQMEVYAVCHFTSNQVQQCVHMRLLLSIWYYSSTSVTILHRWCGFFVVSLLFCLYMFVYMEGVCMHTSVPHSA